MSAATDLDVLKDIPEYKTILKGVIKIQIQLLVEQLAQHTEEESIILTASVSDGTLSHLGTSAGKQFLDGHDEIKSQFLGFCLSTRHTTSQHSASLSDSKVNDLPSPVKKRKLRSTPSAAKRPRIVQSTTVARVTASGDGSDISPSVDSRTSSSEKKRKFVGRKPGPASSRRPIACTSTSDNDDIDSKVKLETASDNQDDEQFDVTEQNTSTPVNLPPSIHLAHTQTTAGDDSDTQDNDNDEVDDVDDFPAGDDDVSDSGSVSNIKVEPITEGEFGSEITGAERSENAEQPAGSDWGPDTSTAEGDDSVDQSPNKSAHMCTMNLSFVEEESIVVNEPDVQVEIDDAVAADIMTSTPKGKQFQCDTCDYTSMYKSNMTRHVTITHGHDLHACEICHKNYKSKYVLTEHISSAHKSNTFLCDICSKMFNTRQAMQRHKQFVHEVKSKYECNFCQRKFFEKSAYFGHLNVHSGNKPYGCTSCSKSYPYKTSLMKHEISCKGEKTAIAAKYSCTQCDATLKSSASKKDHIEGMHGSPKVCGCGKTFKWRSSFARHANKFSAQNDESNLHDESVLEDTCMTANGTTMYPCKMCNNVYKRKEALRRHSRVHNPSMRPSRKEDTGATCEVCGKTFTQLSYLNGHKRCHQQREYSCIICAKEFVTNWMLTRHLESHQGDKNLCPTCGKSFTRRDIMQRHIDTTHLQVGGHTCDICGKVYHNRAQLHGHKIAKHGEEKTLKCTKCNKRFSYMKNLKYHTNNVCGNANNGHGKEKVVEPQPKKCDDCGKYFLSNKSLVQHRHLHEAPSLICSACGRSFKWKSSLTAHSLRCRH